MKNIAILVLLVAAGALGYWFGVRTSDKVQVRLATKTSAK